MPTHREDSEAAIRQLIDTIITGLRAKDLEAVRRAYAGDIVSFDVEPPLQHVGVEAKLHNWAGVFAAFDTVDYEVRDLALTVGEDVAFGRAFGRLSGTLRDGTAVTGMWVRVTYCLRRIDDVWLIVHDHVSVPFEARTGECVVDLEPGPGSG